MANEVKVVFKVDGIEGYITDLNELQTALNKTNTDTKKLSDSQEKAAEDIEDTTNSISNLNKKLKTLQDELDETEIGTDAFEKLQEEIKGVEGELDKAKKGQQSFGDELSNAPGIVGQVSKSVKGLNVAFKALLANPIILVITGIVAAVTALFKAFTSTKEGGEALDRVMAGLSAVFDVFRDVLVTVAEKLITIFSDPKQAIIDFATLIKDNIVNRFEGLLELIPALGEAIGLLFEGEFSEAGKVAADAVGKVALGVEDLTDKAQDAFTAVGDVINEAVEEASEAARLTGILQDLADEERELNVLRAEQNALLAETKLKVDDTTLSIDERKAALEEAGAAETALLEDQLRLENERLDALEALAAQSDSDAETLDELANQRIKIAQLEEQSLNKQTELLGKRKALAAEQKAIDDEEKARAEEKLKRQTEIAEEIRRKQLTEKQLELDDLRIKYEEEQKLAEGNKELLKKLDDQYIKDKAAIEEEYNDKRIEEEKATQEKLKVILDEFVDKTYKTEEERLKAEALLRFEARKKELEELGLQGEELRNFQLQLEKSYQDEVTRITKKGEEDRRKLRKESVQQAGQLVNNLFAGFAALNEARTADDEKEAKKQFELNKAFSISQAVINTALAVTDVLAQEKTGLVGKIIAAVAIGAQGLAQVLNIKKQEFNAGGGSTGGVPIVRPQAALPTAPTSAGEDIDITASPEVGGAQPVQAYVLATDVTSAQEANQQIENISRL